MGAIEEFLGITSQEAYNNYDTTELILISQEAFREMVSRMTELELRSTQLESKDHIGDGHHFGVPCVFCGAPHGDILSSTCDANMPQPAQNDEALEEKIIDLLGEWDGGHMDSDDTAKAIIAAVRGQS